MSSFSDHLRGPPYSGERTTTLRQCMNAGTRNESAAIHAHMLEKHTPGKPNHIDSPNATKQRAIIYSTPAIIANVEYPMPCMVNRTAHTSVSSGKPAVVTIINRRAYASASVSPASRNSVSIC